MIQPISLPALLMAAVSLYVGITYMWMFLRRKAERENLAFAATCISIALYDVFCAGLYSAPSPVEGMVWQRLQFSSLSAFMISISWFLYFFTGYARRAQVIGITIWFALLLAAGVFLRGDLTLSIDRALVKTVELFGLTVRYNEVDPGPFYAVQYASMIAAALYLFITVLRWYRADEKPAWSVVAAMLVFFAAALNDIMVGAGLFSSIYLLEYSYLVILISMTRVLQNRFFGLYREVEELSRRLEEKVNERTMDLFFSEIMRHLYASMAGEGTSEKKLVRSDGNGRSDELSIIGTLVRDIGIITNIDFLLQRSLEKCAQIADAPRGFLYLIDGEGRLALSAQYGDTAPPQWFLDASGRMLWENRHLLLNDHDRYGNPAGRTGNPAGRCHTLMVPVNLRGRSVGACVLQRDGAAFGFTGKEADVAISFTEHAATAIERAYLYQRITEKKRPEREHAVTPAIESKLKKALPYIEEHFRNELSREHIAALLNMHPDSLGRFFKIYTGKKINEYVNELRVNEAAKLLEEGDRPVIDIAFAVGFESLPTFNRAFLKVMKVSPTRYREMRNGR